MNSRDCFLAEGMVIIHTAIPPYSIDTLWSNVPSLEVLVSGGKAFEVEDLARAKRLFVIYRPHLWLGGTVLGNVVATCQRYVSALLDGEVILEGSYLILKPAKCGLEVPYHQDALLDTDRLEEGKQRLSAWIPFVTSLPEDGGLTYVPRSHETGLVEHQPIQRHAGRDQQGVVDRGKYNGAIPICAEKGDIVLIHERLIHGSPPNVGNAARPALVLDFVAI